MAEINRAKMRVAVLAGGRSSEREISFSSGKKRGRCAAHRRLR